MPKNGDINQENGTVFWAIEGGKERWVDPALYLFKKNTAILSQRRRYWSNVEESRRKLREWSRANKDKKSMSFKNWRERNLEKVCDYRLKKTYGISKEQYVAMYEAQGRKCAICGTEESAKRRTGTIHNFCVDHCHTTGKVRGLLCVNCNIAIGKMKDDPKIMLAAAQYIERNSQ